ncbi:MAG: ABC-F family ATP-binding cassette domain-containing protein [Egicoccus sp.]
MISLSGVEVAFGTRALFSDVSLRFPPGRRVALVGGNGAGKTTLLNVVVGNREPDRGTVSRPKDLRIGWLPQDVVDAVGESETVLHHVLEGASHILKFEQELRDLEHRIETAGEEAEQEKLLNRYSTVQDRFTQLGGYEVEAEAHRVLSGLGFAPDDASRPTGELSGGWRVRVALARLLLSKPDLLVLDEPTNHLDLDTIAWLEQTLKELPGGLLFVSHDRDFIDGVADRIVELAAGTAAEYTVRGGTTAAEQGGFASFVEQREDRLTQLRSAKAQQDRQLAQAERFIERFRYKASKARQVQSRIKAVDKVDRIEIPDHRQLVARFAFPEPQRSGRVVAELAGVTKAYDDHPILTGVDLAIERGRKVAMIGPNGAGKTTLLRMLAGSLQPDAGTIELGHNVDVAVVDQHQAEVLDLDRSVVEEFRTALGDRHRDVNHRSMLGAFGFPGDLADRKVGELSGGERTRLGLAKAMASPVNLLLLDEPTNHLDLASRDVLEDALNAYPGTVLLITHDRHVIRGVADAIVEVGGGIARWFDGTYEELQWRRAEAGQTTTAAAPTKSGGTRGGGVAPAPIARSQRGDDDKRRAAELRNARHRATKDLRREVGRFEEQLAKVESRVAELTRALADPAVYEDPDEVKRLVADHGQAKDRAAELLASWEDAQTRLEQAEADVDASFG